MSELSSIAIGAVTLAIAASLIIPTLVSAQNQTSSAQKILSAVKSRAAQAGATSGGNIAVLLVCPPNLTALRDCSFSVLGTLQNITG
jgi:predicted small secreted protein